MLDGRLRQPLLALDLLRFAAAMLVVAFHLLVAHPTGRGGPIAENGWVGVQIFFVLSGYVIARSANGSTARAFAERRLLRLWPAAFVCASLSGLAISLSGAATPDLGWRWLASAMLYPSAHQIDGSYWTLGVECAFYALVALALARRWWSPAGLASLLIAWSAAFWLWAIAGALHTLPAFDRLQELTLMRHGALFGAGLLIEDWHRRGGRFPTARFGAALACGLVGVFFVALRTAGGLQFEPAPAIAAVLFLAGVAVVAMAPRLQPLVERWNRDRAIVALGLATYPLYLLHQEVGLALIALLRGLGMNHLAAIGSTVTILIAASLLVALKIEPLIRGGMRMIRRWPRRAVAPVIAGETA